MTPGLVTLDGLDASIESHLVGNLKSRDRRLLGIEIERLILHRETGTSAPLGFCRELFAKLVDDFDAEPFTEGGILSKLRGPDFGVSMEPGGQLEVDTDPCPDLESLERISCDVTRVIEQRLEGSDYHLVALGHAPVTPVEELGLLPRPRYRIMDAEMPKRGPLTRNMMRATAGLQMACDVSDRTDAGRRMALLNRLTPVLMALTANSRRVGGQDTGWESFRHRVWWETDTTRTGVPEGGLDADTAIDGYVRFARRAIALFRNGDGEVIATPPVPFEELVAEGEVSDDDVALHLSSLFPFVRVRNYLEIRCFDAVEWPLAKSVLALLSGLVYCDKATAATEAVSEPLAVRDPEALRRFHLEAARLGMNAQIPGGVSFREFARGLIEMASSTLGGADCDWSRPEDLAVVRERVES